MTKRPENDPFKGVGVRVSLPTDDAFLKIKETLTRIGIASKKDKVLYQSCHILHKTNRDTDESMFAIVSFKEMFLLDGKNANITEEDISRRNRIAKLLEQWELLEIIDRDIVDEDQNSPYIKIIPFREKSEWDLVEKYSIGSKKRGN